MNSLMNELNSILGEPENLTVSKDGNQVTVEYGNMYSAPHCNLPVLMKVSEFFGTEEIDVDDYNYAGCDTCDYGSDYGHVLHISNATKNLEICA